MNKDSKIYVAGHRGMVGSAIHRKLNREGYNNIVFATSKELDLRNTVDVDHFFKSEQPEYLFLAAAKVGGIHANNTYPADFLYDNLMVQNNVIEASYLYGVKKLLFKNFAFSDLQLQSGLCKLQTAKQSSFAVKPFPN